jgi:hypothetical protein
MDLVKQGLNAFTSTGNEIGVYSQNSFKPNPYEMDFGREKEDIRWLL